MTVFICDVINYPTILKTIFGIKKYFCAFFWHFNKKYYFYLKLQIMTVKKKDPRGRKELPVMEQKVPVRIFVKRKNLAKATAACAAIAARYR